MALALEGKNQQKRLGLNWNSALETGGVLVSEEVRLNINYFYNNNFKNRRKWQRIIPLRFVFKNRMMETIHILYIGRHPEILKPSSD
jgi:hypothetical protein